MNDVIGRVTGNFGIWQLRAVLIIFLCKIPASWFMAVVIYTAPAPIDGEVYCEDPAMPKDSDTMTWIKTIHPIVKSEGLNRTHVDYCHTFDNVLGDSRSFEKANISQENTTSSSSKISSMSSSAPDLIECQNFIHRADYQSLVTQFNLVCDRDILVAWTQFFHLFGVLAGGITATKIMEFHSPRHTMMMGMISQIACGILTGYAQTFELHCFFRCLSAVCCALMFTGGTVIFSEITGGKYRTGVNILFDQFWSIGVILLPGVASFFGSWIHLYVAISVPTTVLIFLYPWIPDAPRWHLKRGHFDRVEMILREAADLNERESFVPENLEECLQVQAKLMNQQTITGWWTLWKGPKMITIMIAAHIAWAVYVVNFNGMLLNIRSFSSEYIVINTIVTGFSEIIGCFMALFFTMKTKRKWMWAGVYNILAGALGFAGWVLPDEVNEILRVSLWMLISSIAKAGVSISQSMLMGCCGELVPECKRQIFVFSCIVFARIWLLTAPFINVFKNIDTALSLSFFTFIQLIGGICSILLQSKPTDKNNDPKEKSKTTVDSTEQTNSVGSSVSNVWITTPDHRDSTKL